MADVTINELTNLAPSNSDVFPFSTTGVTPSTYKASLAQIRTALSIPTINDLQLCKAWVNFDGRGSIGVNQTIRSQFNISSVYKFNSGSYTITFSNALSNANYCAVGMLQYQNNNGLTFLEGPSDSTTSSFKVYSRQSGGPLTDSQFMSIAVFSL